MLKRWLVNRREHLPQFGLRYVGEVFIVLFEVTEGLSWAGDGEEAEKKPRRC